MDMIKASASFWGCLIYEQYYRTCIISDVLASPILNFCYQPIWDVNKPISHLTIITISICFSFSFILTVWSCLEISLLLYLYKHVHDKLRYWTWTNNVVKTQSFKFKFACRERRRRSSDDLHLTTPNCFDMIS